MVVRTILVIMMLLAGPVRSEELPVFDGLVEPRELVEFSSPIPGILEKVLVERGDWVKQGQVVARLKSGVAMAKVRLAQAKLDFGIRKIGRNEQLYQKKLISVHDRDGLETEIELAELELAEARERLDLLTIRSTVDGVVVHRTGAAGEYVGEDPFLAIARIDPLSVELVVPVDYFGRIKENDEATVTLDPPVGGDYRARVIIVDRVVDAASGTFGVRLELANSDRKLPAGIRCRVTF